MIISCSINVLDEPVPNNAIPKVFLQTIRRPLFPEVQRDLIWNKYRSKGVAEIVPLNPSPNLLFILLSFPWFWVLMTSSIHLGWGSTVGSNGGLEVYGRLGTDDMLGSKVDNTDRVDTDDILGAGDRHSTDNKVVVEIGTWSLYQTKDKRRRRELSWSCQRKHHDCNFVQLLLRCTNV